MDYDLKNLKLNKKVEYNLAKQLEFSVKAMKPQYVAKEKES